MQVLGSSPDFLSWSFCLVEVCPHEMSSLSISLAALWEAWLEGWVPGERAAGTEAVAMEVGYWGPPHPPSDQGQTLGVSHGKGVLGRLRWAPAWGARLSASVPLEGTSSGPVQTKRNPQEVPGSAGPLLTLALLPGGGPCKQQCRDTGEEVVCSCFVGYQLLPDGVSCEGKRCPAPRASASA